MTLLGFAPGLPPNTPGAVVDGYGFYPTLRGLKASYGWREVQELYNPLTYGVAVEALMVASDEMIVCTTTHVLRLYYALSITITDITPSGYIADNVINLNRFGNYIILAALNNSWSRLANSAAAWTALGVQQDVSFAHGFYHVRTVDGEWFTSDIGDPTDWTIGSGSQAQSGTFPDTDGDVIDGGSLGQYAVLYKNNGIWLGQNVGPPLYWDWQKVPSGDGCRFKRSLIALKDAHYYIGEDDIYAFNLGRPQSIGQPVKDWLLRTLYRSLERVKVVYEPTNELLCWFLGGYFGQPYSYVLTYHVPSGRFGLDLTDAETPVKTQVYWGSHQHFLGGIDWVSPRMYKIVAGKLYIQNAESTGSKLVFAQYGQADQDTQVNRVRMLYSTTPVTATCTHDVRERLDDTPVKSQSNYSQDGKHDFHAVGRWHQDTVEMGGMWELLDAGPAYPKGAGKR